MTFLPRVGEGFTSHCNPTKMFSDILIRPGICLIIELSPYVTKDRQYGSNNWQKATQQNYLKFGGHMLKRLSIRDLYGR